MAVPRVNTRGWEKKKNGGKKIAAEGQRDSSKRIPARFNDAYASLVTRFRYLFMRGTIINTRE